MRRVGPLELGESGFAGFAVKKKHVATLFRNTLRCRLGQVARGCSRGCYKLTPVMTDLLSGVLVLMECFSDNIADLFLKINPETTPATVIEAALMLIRHTKGCSTQK